MLSHSRPTLNRCVRQKLATLLATLSVTPAWAVDLDARGIPRGAAVTPTLWCLGVGDASLYVWQQAVAEILSMGGVVHGIAHDTNGNRLSYFALVCAPQTDVNTLVQ